MAIQSTKSNNAGDQVPAVGYVRRSTDKQEASLPEQVEAIEKYAVERGFKVLRWYTDDAISGDDTRNRAAFRQMIRDAGERGDFRVILCWDRARFGRFDSIEYGYFVFPLREAGVTLATVQDGITDWSDPSMRIVAGLMQEGKHQQLLDHSANVARGQLGAARNGGYLGAPPYGYRLEGPRKCRRLVIADEGKVAVVRRIFKEYVHDDRSMHEIARRLNADGFPSSGGRVNGWRWDAVKCILSNPAYSGDRVAYRQAYGKYHHMREGRVEKGARKGRNPKSEWVVIPDTHEAIVDRDTFAAAQAILARGKTGRSPYTADANPYRFAGLLRCGRCGTALHGMERQGRKYYHCGHRRYNGPSACEGTTVREDVVLTSLADRLEGWLGAEGEGLGGAAFYGVPLRAEDLPEAFAEVRRLVMPPVLPKKDRAKLSKQADTLRAQVAKARDNLVLLDASNIPAAQAKIKALEAQLGDVEKELADTKAPPERELNAIVLDVLHSLYGLANCCRALARKEEPGWQVVGSIEQAAPAVLRRLAKRISRITVHTDITGRGNGIRHVFARGEVEFSVCGVTMELNHRLLRVKQAPWPLDHGTTRAGGARIGPPDESTQWELNPHVSVGNAAGCRYIMSAFE